MDEGPGNAGFAGAGVAQEEEAYGSVLPLECLFELVCWEFCGIGLAVEWGADFVEVLLAAGGSAIGAFKGVSAWKEVLGGCFERSGFAAGRAEEDWDGGGGGVKGCGFRIR